MRRLLTTALIINVLFIALHLPAYPDIPWLAADAMLLTGLFALLPRRHWRAIGAYAIGVLYSLLLVGAAGEALIRESLGRGLNLYLDISLLGSVYNLLMTNLNPGPALAVMIAAVVLLLALAALAGYLLSTIRPVNGGRGPAVIMLGAGLLALLPALPGEPTASAIIADQLALAAATRQATAQFEARINQPAHALPYQPDHPPLAKLRQTDVIVGFIESYGISSLTDPRYTPLIGVRLATMQQKIAASGLHMASGRLRSPVQGGQSWLAHATLMSGQWVDSQLDYEVLLASDYPTLIDDFRASGHATVAVMPAITRDWPEGRQFGYDRIHDSRNMDYQGPNLNWVTMPDQYTWSWLQRALREPDPRPLFAEVALISSHAPWVPIIDVLSNWDGIGDGRVFNLWSARGETPDSLWRNHDRVREHYARAIDYAINVVTEYAVRYVDGRTLLVIVGDHQAAPLITGEDASRDVLVHVISANPALLAPFIDPSAGLATFQAGALPTMGTPAVGMDQFRPFLKRRFSEDQ